MTLDEFFDGFEVSHPLLEAVIRMIASVGPFSVRVSRSQITSVRLRAFAGVWVPARHLPRSRAPLVLSLAFNRRDASARWKQVAEPTPGASCITSS